MKLFIEVLILVMGVLLLIGALEKRRKRLDPRLRYADAVITGITVTEMGNRNTQHTVKVEYEADGTVRSAKLDIYTMGMHVGDHVAVLVGPDEPDRVMLASSLASLIMLIAGCVFIGSAILLYLK